MSVDIFKKLNKKDQDSIVKHLHDLVLEKNPKTFEEFYKLAQIVCLGRLMFIYHDRYGLTLNTMKKVLEENNV